MRVELKPHPDTPCEAVSRLCVDVERAGERLTLRYQLSGQVERLLLPARMAPARADELWKHTCFEAFARGGEGEAYCEFNFAPSTQWAAYCFDRYRKGMRNAEDVDTPEMELASGPGVFELAAAVTLATPGAWRVALSAVIEETDGTKSYWALKHPPGKPDFHHADGFALEI